MVRILGRNGHEQPPNPNRLAVHGRVAADDGHPFVVLQWGKQLGQLPPAGARDLALELLEAAESSEHDAATILFLRDRYSLDQTQAAHMLNDLRRFRAEGSSPAPEQPAGEEPAP